MSERKSILVEAEAIVNGERAADYGDSVANVRRIAVLAWNMLDDAEREQLPNRMPDTVVIKVLMAVKIARERNLHKRDNLVDLCGYAELLDRQHEAN